MKVFILEFNFFCGAHWENIDIRITAQTKVQLIKAFLMETYWMNENRSGKTKKELWQECNQRIQEDDLKFPIIERL